MVSHVTNGVRVSVESHYQSNLSNPLEGEFVFAYRIRIENGSPETIQVMSRHWDILDSNGRTMVVEGDGVLGLQPEIPSGEIHEYGSWCRLRTEMGKMSGYYLVRNIHHTDRYRISVPEFRLIAPMKLN